MSDELEVLGHDDAQRLTERIRLSLDSVSQSWDRLASQVAEAYQRRADRALGYESWAAYAEAEFSAHTANIAAPIRRELVSTLSAAGLSTRAIAPAVGVSDMTVRRDQHEVRHDVAPAAGEPEVSIVEPATGEIVTEPEPSKGWSDFAAAVEAQLNDDPAPARTPVVGLDGKTYTKPAAPKPRRHSLVDDAVKVSRDLAAVAERLRAITSDDRFQTNKSDIQDAVRPAAALVQEALTDLQITTH